MRSVLHRWVLAAVMVVLVASCRGEADLGSAIDDPVTGRSSGTAEGTGDPTPAPTTATVDGGCDRLRPSELAEADATVRFFAVCGPSGDSVPYSIHRSFTDSAVEPGLQGGLDLLTAGLTEAERAAGLFSWFDPQPGQEPVTIDVTVDADGVASLDHRQGDGPWRPDAGTSAQVFSLVDPLAATLFAHPEVTAIDRAGLCFRDSGLEEPGFGDLDCGGVLTRGEFEDMMFLNHGVVTSSGCDLVGFWERPEQCRLDAVTAPERLRAAVVTGVAEDDTLNLRAGPRAQAWIVDDSLGTGTEVEATDVFRQAPDGGLWRIIVGPGGSTGWVNDAFLTVERTAEELLADRFVDFASGGSSLQSASLPFAAEVSLGLGPDIVTVVDRVDLADRDRWVLDAEFFRGYVGPFSVLEPLSRAQARTVTVGEYRRCAGDPGPAPRGLADATRISIQPSRAVIDSCLQWYAVDLFVEGDGEIVAVTFDTWEP